MIPKLYAQHLQICRRLNVFMNYEKMKCWWQFPLDDIHGLDRAFEVAMQINEMGSILYLNYIFHSRSVFVEMKFSQILYRNRCVRAACMRWINCRKIFMDWMRLARIINNNNNTQNDNNVDLFTIYDLICWHKINAASDTRTLVSIFIRTTYIIIIAKRCTTMVWLHINALGWHSCYIYIVVMTKYLANPSSALFRKSKCFITLNKLINLISRCACAAG